MSVYGTGIYGAGTYGAAPVGGSGYGFGVYGAGLYGGGTAPTLGIGELQIELGFGFAPGDAGVVWVDVSEWVDGDFGSSIEMSSGRGSIRSGVEPGDLSFELDNDDRRFDPTYTGGPYYGQLLPGVPVRVRVTVDGSTTVRWRGYVRSGWAQSMTNRRPVVQVDCHDLFGQLAQSDPPVSTWAAFLSAYTVSPAHQWVPGPDGWFDTVTGRSARHTTKLVQQSGGDPLIAGGEQPWGQADPEGVGVVTDPAARLDTSATAITVLMRTKITAATSDAVVVLRQDDTSELTNPFDIIVNGLELNVLASTPARFRSTSTFNQDGYITDGEPHTLMVHAPVTSGVIRVWVDGVEVNGAQTDTALVRAQVLGDLQIGEKPGALLNTYTGFIDPVLVWENHPGTAAELAALAADSHTAMTRAWSGQRLDQRLASIVDSVGLGADIGALDVSGTVTLQGYRSGNTLDLLQTIEETEQGRLSVDRDGQLRMAARSWAWSDVRSTTVQLTLSDDPVMLTAGTAQELVESDTQIVFDPYKVTNVAKVTSENGRMQVVEDQASIARYGRRNPTQLSGLLHASDKASRSIAEWIVFSQGEVEPRVEQVSFWVDGNPTVLGPVARDIEEGWLVRVVKAAPVDDAGAPIGSAVDVEAHVIGMRHRFTVAGWFVVLLLDSSRAGRNWFTWDDGTGTVGTAWDDGTGTVSAAGWSF